MALSDPVYNRLAFNGYVVFIKYISGAVFTQCYREASHVADLMRDQPFPSHFPNAAEAAMIATNEQRGRGYTCMPWMVKDRDDVVLWSSDK